MDDDGRTPKPFGKGIRNLFGKGRIVDTEDLTEEEILTVVNEGHEQGVLEETEAEMISNILGLSEKSASDIMTHRKNFHAVEATVTLREMIATAQEVGCSRYPVYLEDIDNIVGVVHIKDLLRHVMEPERMEVPIREIDELILPVPFIPESRHIDVLFKGMQSQKKHMVIVVDEYGQTAGLVTMEDILEEIVGNIWDEHDEEEQYFTPDSDGGYLMDGQMEFDEFCRLLGIEEAVKEDESLDEVDTLNGFIIARIDRIPADGEEFCVSAFGYQFHVLLVENRMIRTVRVLKEPLKEATDPKESL